MPLALRTAPLASQAPKGRFNFSPVQHWVPDLRDPRVRAAIRREAALLAQHPENAAIDDWIDAAYDWSEWR